MSGEMSADFREDVPLKSYKRPKNFSCCTGQDCFGGSKLVSSSFAVLSLVITSALILQIYYGDFQVVPHGSVASDSRECSEIGTAILKQNGNAVDAVIATAFCLAIVNPHVTGLDAEGQFMIYNHRLRETPQVVTFRRNLNTKLADLLPRMVIGLAYIHLQYGSLQWKDLLAPSVKLARRGFLVPKSLVSAIKLANAESLFGNLEAGQFYHLPHIAGALQRFADIPEEDLSNYITLESTPIKSDALRSEFHHHHIYVPNAPSIGPELLMNLEMLSQFNFTQRDTKRAEYYYRLAETTSHLYAQSNITLNFHEGTSSNVAAIDKDENYVSLVTGLYQLFGSKELNADGYILDEPSPGNTPCSRVPVIITDGDFICGRRLVLGANSIATAGQVISGLLIAMNNATTSVESPRFSLFSDGTVGFEDDHIPSFPDEVIEYLETLGRPVHIKEPYASCNIVEQVADELNSHSDSRGGGISSRF